MDDEEDKANLIQVAKDVHKRLSAENDGLRMHKELTLKPSKTRGWRVELASLGRGEPRLEVWFCQYAREGRRFFWYGFYAAQADKLGHLVNSLPESLREVQEFSGLDMRLASNTNDEYVLRMPLDSVNFNHPIYEEYQESGYRYSYYGKYDSFSPVNEETMPGIVARASNFFGEVLKARG